MPPTRSSRRARAQHPSANPYANAAGAHQPGAAAPALPGSDQAHPPPRRNLFLLLPAELRNKIYDHHARRTQRAILSTAGKPTIALGRHALSRISKQIRAEYLARVLKLHRARRYKVEVADFDFGRLMHHLRQNDRLARVDRITIRMTFTTADINTSGVLAWLKFVQRHTFAHRYEVWGMPLVRVRRQFMSRIFQMGRDFAEEGAWPEADFIVRPLREFWARGKGEMTWARPGEVPPMGWEEWERSAGTDVDSEGESE